MGAPFLVGKGKVPKRRKRAKKKKGGRSSGKNKIIYKSYPRGGIGVQNNAVSGYKGAKE